MADTIGRITVPAPVKSGTTFPLVTEYGYGMTRDWAIVEHRFGELATLGVQRYSIGSGARHFQFIKTVLNAADRQALIDFYDTTQGAYQSFTYPVPNPDRATFTNYEVVFDMAPVSLTDLAMRAQTGLTFTEIIDPTAAPSYTIGSVVTRFPPDSLASALASEVQVIIPLIHIKVRTPGVPDIYFSDRRVNISGFPGAPSPTTFLPRILGIGSPGTSDILMSQSIDGRADNVSFRFGNADRAMSLLLNDCSIEYASIDMSFLHVGTGTLIQLWRGIILSWQIDGSPVMSVQCSDGLYPITQSYPLRTVSRQCWKPFNKDIVPGFRPCPYSTAGSGGDPSTCDYFFNSANGCLAHGMSQYFGGHPEQPQSVVIKDNGTGIMFGFFRQTVTSTSILSDSIWGNPLPEIWCNDFGSPIRAFWQNCMVAAVRDESDFIDLLGIVGAGPLGGFEGMSVQTNTDGYKFVVSPTADGFFPQGFKVDGNLNITGYQPTLGLRQSLGPDPAYKAPVPTIGNDAFSLGQGTPQHWDIPDPTYSNDGVANSIIPYAAGTAVCEIRYPKPAGGGLSPTTAESHNMQVPIRWGLTGSTFDPTGATRTLVVGLVNPFWVAANTYLRALGLASADATTQLSYLVLNSITNASGTGCADIAALSVDPIVGTVLPAYQITSAGMALTHYNLDINNNSFTYLDSSSAFHSLTLTQAQTAGYITLVSQPNKEVQFQFQGALTEFKPFRDWMTEILNCCLGYYCFEFGKLKLGIRYSAVPTDSFTVGSMLYQSLTVTPISAQFEYLKLTFANVALQYQQDLAEYQDKDHSSYYGRAGAPLTSSMKSVGTSTLSQGLRIAVSRTREEIGGILRSDQSNPYIEWDNNKRITFKSTLLALNTEIGQVIGVTHPDLPTYPGAAPGSRAGSNGPFAANTWPYRIKKWILHSDYSVSIMADSCVDSMYDLEVGPQPKGVGPRPLPVMFYPEPLGQWAPYQVQADPADALYPGEWTFNLAQTFQYLGDGTLLTSAVLAGALPVNRFVANCGAPDIKKGNVSWSTTGGNIPGGITIFFQICATISDTSGSTPVVKQYSPPSEILVLHSPYGTNTNQFTLNNITWPPVTGLNGYIIFANTVEDLICGQPGSALGQPSSITFAGPLSRQTYAVPDYDMQTLRVRAQVLIHGGVLGCHIDAVTASPNTIVSANAIDVAGTDNWTGRVLAIVGRQLGDGIAPFAHFNITAFDNTTGTFTLDRDPVAAGVQVDDICAVQTLGVDNSSNPYLISDPGLANCQSTPPHSGETVNDPNRIGRIVRVIKGTSRGLRAKIVSNTATSYTLDQPLPTDATSVWVLTDPAWTYSTDIELDNADPSKTTLMAIEINNYLGTAFLIEGVTIDTEGGIVDDTDACVRMLYIPGVQSTTTIAS